MAKATAALLGIALALTACSSGGVTSPEPSASQPEQLSATASLVDQQSVHDAGASVKGNWTVTDGVSDAAYSSWDTGRTIRPVSCSIVSQVGAGLVPKELTSDGKVSSVVLDQGNSEVFQYIVTGTDTAAISKALTDVLPGCKAYSWREDSGTTLNGGMLVDSSTVTMTGASVAPDAFRWSTKFKTTVHDCDKYKPSGTSDCAHTSSGTYKVEVTMVGDSMIVSNADGTSVAALPAIHQQTVDRFRQGR